MTVNVKPVLLSVLVASCAPQAVSFREEAYEASLQQEEKERADGVPPAASFHFLEANRKSQENQEKSIDDKIYQLSEQFAEKHQREDPRKREYFNSDKPLQEIIQSYSETDAGSAHQQRRIVVRKSERLLSLYIGESLLKEYPVGLSVGSRKDKEQEGDGQTPEGTFYISLKILKGTFDKSLLISYPDKEDAERGLQEGLISKGEYRTIFSAIDSCKAPPQKTALGGEILIHGGSGSYDWTAGCVALDEHDEIYAFARSGCYWARDEQGRRMLIPRTIVEIRK